jgi:hypothetical protein
VKFFPINDFSQTGIIQYMVSNQGSSYIDLSKTRLHVCCKIVKKDGKAMKSGADANAENCAPINNFLHSLFRRVDVQLNGKTVSSAHDGYPYLAYFNNLLYTNNAMKQGTLQTEMFYSDTAGEAMDQANFKTADNDGLKMRGKFFEGSSIVDLVGPIHCDIFKISKLIPYGVSIGITLYQNEPEFCLMSADSDIASSGYKVVILKSFLEMSLIEIAPEISLAHSKILEKTTAFYPYTKTQIRKFSIAKDVFSAEFSDPFLNQIPSEMLIGLISDVSCHGSWDKNPLSFMPHDVSNIQVTVDGQQLGHGNIEVVYSDEPENGQYMQGYTTLCCLENNEGVNPIPRLDYPGGYCLYRIASEFANNISDHDVVPVKRTGNLRISVTFAKKTPEPLTLIIYAKQGGAVKIDLNKAVYLV